MARLVRSSLAVLAGLAVAVILFQVGAVVAFVVLYGIPLGASVGSPSLGYFALNFGFAALAALAAGSLTARLAGRKPLAHSAALSILIAVLVLWGFTRPASHWPGWYPPILALVGVAGSLAGGWLRRE